MQTSRPLPLCSAQVLASPSHSVTGKKSVLLRSRLRSEAIVTLATVFSDLVVRRSMSLVNRPVMTKVFICSCSFWWDAVDVARKARCACQPGRRRPCIPIGRERELDHGGERRQHDESQQDVT